VCFKSRLICRMYYSQKHTLLLQSWLEVVSISLHHWHQYFCILVIISVSIGHRIGSNILPIVLVIISVVLATILLIISVSICHHLWVPATIFIVLSFSIIYHIAHNIYSTGHHIGSNVSICHYLLVAATMLMETSVKEFIINSLFTSQKDICSTHGGDEKYMQTFNWKTWREGTA
jgi:hypothetical protein